MADNFASFAPGLDSPFAGAFAVTPSDTADMAIASRGIYVGGAGNIKVDMVGVGTVTFTAVPVGSTLNVRAKRIYATGTTATLLVGLY